MSETATPHTPGLATAIRPPAERVLLAGDVGGTKTMLAIFSPDGSLLAEETYASREFDSLEAMIGEFRAAHPIPISGVALSVAGPVIRGQARITNLPWQLDAARLCDRLDVGDVRLVNDLQATAHALPHLHPAQILTLQCGVTEPAGARAVIAVGTGLGEAMLLPDAGGYLAVPSEGGHTDFAPRDRLQRGLLAHLSRSYDHVSYERVCSGLGIPNIYRYLRERVGEPEPAWMTAALEQAEDPTPLIVKAALSKREPCRICRHTLAVFSAILGAEAGNLALRALATGGVYIGGGVPPRLIPVLRGRAFANGFLRKGPMSGVVARIPVHVIMEPRAALLGAARYGLSPA
jgi:glucokinase